MHKRIVEKITITEALVYGSGDWRAEIECRDEDGDRWYMRCSGTSPADVAEKIHSIFLGEDWEMWGFVTEFAKSNQTKN